VTANAFLALLGLLLGVAFLAEAAFARFRLPPALVLIGCGLALGANHGVPAERFLAVAPHFGALAFLLILFEGGLDLDLDDVTRRLTPGVQLALASFALAVLSTLLVLLFSGVGARAALTVAVVVAPISGSIVIPLLARLGLDPGTRTLLVLEAALADVLGILALGLVATILTGGGFAALVAAGSLLAALFAVALGVALGLVWPRTLRRLGEQSYLDALTFGVALTAWGVCGLLGAPGALAALAFGFALANEDSLLRLFRLPPTIDEREIRRAASTLHGFVGQLTFLARTYFFVFIGLVVGFRDLPLRRYAEALAVLGLFLVGRGFATRWLERRVGLFSDATERRLALFVQPRGLVTAVLAIEAAHLDLPGHEVALGLASLVIVGSNLLLLAGVRGRAGGGPLSAAPSAGAGDAAVDRPT
jgi:cell volume regulation protein A